VEEARNVNENQKVGCRVEICCCCCCCVVVSFVLPNYGKGGAWPLFWLCIKFFAVCMSVWDVGHSAQFNFRGLSGVFWGGRVNVTSRSCANNVPKKTLYIIDGLSVHSVIFGFKPKP
jgi:hypothetical protein